MWQQWSFNLSIENYSGTNTWTQKHSIIDLIDFDRYGNSVQTLQRGFYVYAAAARRVWTHTSAIQRDCIADIMWMCASDTTRGGRAHTHCCVCIKLPYLSYFIIHCLDS